MDRGASEYDSDSSGTRAGNRKPAAFFFFSSTRSAIEGARSLRWWFGRTPCSSAPLWSTQHTTTTQPRAATYYIRRRRRCTRAEPSTAAPREDAFSALREALAALFTHTWARAVRHASSPTTLFFHWRCCSSSSRLAHNARPDDCTCQAITTKKRRNGRKGWERRRGKTLPRTRVAGGGNAVGRGCRVY